MEILSFPYINFTLFWKNVKIDTEIKNILAILNKKIISIT